MSSIDIGINEQDRANIAEGLKRLLADSYTLYLQTQQLWLISPPLLGFASSPPTYKNRLFEMLPA